MTVDLSVLLEAALIMTGGIVGAAIGTLLGLAIWSRRMNRRYAIPNTITTSRNGATPRATYVNTKP